MPITNCYDNLKSALINRPFWLIGQPLTCTDLAFWMIAGWADSGTGGFDVLHPHPLSCGWGWFQKAIVSHPEFSRLHRHGGFCPKWHSIPYIVPYFWPEPYGPIKIDELGPFSASSLKSGSTLTSTSGVPKLGCVGCSAGFFLCFPEPIASAMPSWLASTVPVIKGLDRLCRDFALRP